MTTPTKETLLNCDGYQKLLEAVRRDENKSPGFHNYRGKLEWVVDRANHYAEKTGLSAEQILDAWEQRRSYWYMNFYQESSQPKIEGDKVRVFDTVEELHASIGTSGFRCPHCKQVSKSPYACDSGFVTERDKKPCDWKVYGLLDLGSVTVFVKQEVAMEKLFVPVAWEPGKMPEVQDA